MRLFESVEILKKKMFLFLRSKWPEPLEPLKPTWKLTFITPKYREKFCWQWHHSLKQIKRCISWDFSFQTWCFVLSTSADPFRMKFKTNREKKNSKISVQSFNWSHISKTQLYKSIFAFSKHWISLS